MGKIFNVFAGFIFSATIVKADLGEFVKAGDVGTENLCVGDLVGEICRLDHYQADMYCRSQNARLPTIRELAFDVQLNHGALGISDTEGSGSYLISTIETTNGLPNGLMDHFYFNPTGYHFPMGQFWVNYGAWSSSLQPDNFDYAHSISYPNGNLYTLERYYSYYGIGFRCMW